MTNSNSNTVQQNELSSPIQSPKTPNILLSPHSLDPILNNEALSELEDAALFLLSDDDHHILSRTNSTEEEEKGSIGTPIIETNYAMNAVHMEVQENAKIPTLRETVNRSNSGNNFVKKPHYVREILTKELDDLLENEDDTFVEGFKLAEMFLHCNERHSASLAYTNVMQNKLQIKPETSLQKKSSKSDIKSTPSSLTRNLYLNTTTEEKPKMTNEKSKQKEVILSPDAIATAAALASVQNLFHVKSEDTVKKEVDHTDSTDKTVTDELDQKTAVTSTASSTKETSDVHKQIDIVSNATNEVKQEEKKDKPTSSVIQIISNSPTPKPQQTPPSNNISTDVVQQTQPNNQEHTVAAPIANANFPAAQQTQSTPAFPVATPVVQQAQPYVEQPTVITAQQTQPAASVATPVVQQAQANLEQPTLITATNIVQPVPAPVSLLPPYTTQYYHPYTAGYPAPAPTPPALFPPAPHYPFNTLMPTSILEASRRQNQFGFSNHVVPSVPPPPAKYGAQPAPVSYPNQYMHIMPPVVPAPSAPVVPAPAPTPHTQYSPKPKTKITPTENNSAVAYERKKQRAKDSRVKFNDAVEKLSVAISLAGDESKIRSSKFNTEISEVMMECSAIAATAKKYDRPSFVATAALLLQGMNGQCDALVREIEGLRKEKDVLLQQINQTDTTLKRKSRDNNHDPTNSSNDQLMTPEDTPPKRNKLIQDNIQLTKQDHFSSITNYGPVLQTISSYLDPLSLTRCISVSKQWKNIQQFQNDTTWEPLCLKRFGLVQLQRHQQQSMLTTYKNMALSNIKPISKLMNDENIVHLAETTNCKIGINTVVCMTQRSNGETLRSVLTSKVENQIPIPSVSDIIIKPEYTALPIVELRILIQNYKCSTITIPNQFFMVDKSTRRREEHMSEVIAQYNDFRFEKSFYNLDGGIRNENEELRLFDTVIISVFIYAHKCPTSYRFLQRAKFLKFVVSQDGVTIPIIIPFDGRNIESSSSIGEDSTTTVVSTVKSISGVCML